MNWGYSIDQSDARKLCHNRLHLPKSQKSRHPAGLGSRAEALSVSSHSDTQRYDVGLSKLKLAWPLGVKELQLRKYMYANQKAHVLSSKIMLERFDKPFPNVGETLSYSPEGHRTKENKLPWVLRERGIHNNNNPQLRSLNTKRHWVV